MSRHHWVSHIANLQFLGLTYCNWLQNPKQAAWNFWCLYIAWLFGRVARDYGSGRHLDWSDLINLLFFARRRNWKWALGAGFWGRSASAAPFQIWCSQRCIKMLEGGSVHLGPRPLGYQLGCAHPWPELPLTQFFGILYLLFLELAASWSQKLSNQRWFWGYNPADRTASCSLARSLTALGWTLSHISD